MSFIYNRPRNAGYGYTDSCLYNPYMYPSSYGYNPYLYNSYMYANSPFSPLPYILPSATVPYYLQNYNYGLIPPPPTPLQIAYSNNYG
jgi:hypothetical protein